MICNISPLLDVCTVPMVIKFLVIMIGLKVAPPLLLIGLNLSHNFNAHMMGNHLPHMYFRKLKIQLI